jgi:hypothetical protein
MVGSVSSFLPQFQPPPLLGILDHDVERLLPPDMSSFSTPRPRLPVMRTCGCAQVRTTTRPLMFSMCTRPSAQRAGLVDRRGGEGRRRQGAIAAARRRGRAGCAATRGAGWDGGWTWTIWNVG